MDRDETGECLCGQKKTLIQVNFCCQLSTLKNIFFQETVVGGEFAEVNEFPWAALLSLNYSGNGATARCGGSLISDRLVAENSENTMEELFCSDTSSLLPTVSSSIQSAETRNFCTMTSLLS